MNVPVEDQHPGGSELTNRELRGDCNVVEDAEAHRTSALGMVTRRAQHRKANVVLTRQKGAYHRACAPSGMQSRGVRALSDKRVVVEPSTTAFAQLSNPRYVGGRVHQRRALPCPDAAGASLASQPLPEPTRQQAAVSIAAIRSGTSGCSGMNSRGSCSSEDG